MYLIFVFSILEPSHSGLTDTQKKKNHHLSRSDIKFITDMIESHGTNYKVWSSYIMLNKGVPRLFSIPIVLCAGDGPW